jgi:hypothetical protein
MLFYNIDLRSMFKFCGISKPDPLNPPDRGTLNVRTERPEILLIPSPMRGEIERGRGGFVLTLGR